MSKIVCHCFQVTEETLLEFIRHHRPQGVEEVTARTNAAGGCMTCYDDVLRLLHEARGTRRIPRAGLDPLEAEAHQVLDELRKATRHDPS